MTAMAMTDRGKLERLMSLTFGDKKTPKMPASKMPSPTNERRPLRPAFKYRFGGFVGRFST